MEEVLGVIEKETIPSHLADKLISVVASEVENLTTSDLIKLINLCLKLFQQEQEQSACTWWKDLMPQLLTVISEKPEVEHDGVVISGTEFKGQVITTILLSDWKASMISNIASMFVDVKLSSEEHIKIVKKLCKFENLKPNEIPPLTHQLLQLTKEQNSVQVFLSLAEYFDSKLYNHIQSDNSSVLTQMITDDGPLKEIQTMEDAVLYHIYNATRILSPKSMKDFMKVLKECLPHPQFIFRPFFVTLLLNVSSISYTFTEETVALLTSAIVRSLTENEKVLKSAWLQTIVPPAINIEDIFNKVIQNCSRGRDGILKGLVNLAFSLLGSKGKVKEMNSEKVWNLGSTLLVDLIQKYPHVTQEVVKNLVNQISQVHDSSQFTDCLIRIACKRPLSLLDCSSMIMQLLGNVCARLSSLIGQKVLYAVLPLTKMSPALRDNLIVFLRKALFSDQSCREMAVYGFLELLKILKITDIRALSQSVSQNYVGITQIYSATYDNTSGAISNEGMCLEILTILRQVFDYHHRVKSILYNGVCDTFYVNPKLGPHILENLKGHFETFYRGPQEIPPIDFSKIIFCQDASVIIKEPIAHLLLGMVLIIAKTEDDSTIKIKLSEMLSSISESMIESDIQHFGLDVENYDNDDGSPFSNKVKNEKIRQILGVYEALMGYVLCTWRSDSVEAPRLLHGLFKGYSRMSDYAKGSGKSTKKKQDDKKSTQCKDSNQGKSKCELFVHPPTILNLKCISRLLAVLNGMPVTWAVESNNDLLKGKRDLHRYAYNATLELIAEARSLSLGELQRNRYMLQYLSYVGRIIHMQCLLRLSGLKEFDMQCAAMSMECFYELLSFVNFHFTRKLSKFLTEIGVEAKDINVQVKTILDTVLDELVELLEETNEAETKDEVQPRKLCLALISIASLLINHLPKEGIHIQQVLDKLKYICMEKKTKNVTVTKALISLFLVVHSKCKPYGSHVLDLILCLCDSMTLIDEEMEVEAHKNYAIVDAKTANSCIVAVCEAVHVSLNKIEWALHRCKAELMVLVFPTDEPLHVRHEVLIEKEKEICRLLNFNIKILSMMCTIAVPPGALADTVLREIGSTYNKLILATKYFLYKFLKHRQTFLSAKFDKTVKTTDHELTKNMYCFTEHIIADGAASTDDPPIKKQKKDATALKNKVLKETKIIPKVIYEKEQFQKFILQLSNKTKIDLQLKNPMARDYRLYAKKVKEIIEKENIYMEDVMEGESSNEDNEETTQASKKLKTQE
ncbi:hypothetical protein RUM43_007993 [Polyplax serrata]|uniref:Fanconi anemia group I protein n=1 Tax=Polyplax serrata TaxID=468196 RepID=A0AAN8Q6N8_POLSC